MKILVGNSFPYGLIAHPVRVEPRTLNALRRAASKAEIVSFWGHADSLDALRDETGLDLSPGAHRPAVSLDADGYPSLNGESFTEVWIVAPRYPRGVRPRTADSAPVDIESWRVLRMSWASPSDTPVPSVRRSSGQSVRSPFNRESSS